MQDNLKSNPDKYRKWLESYLKLEDSLPNLDSGENFRNLTQFEESLVAELYGGVPESDLTGSSAYTSFREDLDIAKAYMVMREEHLKPVPEYLLRYVDKNITKPEREKSLLVRLAQHGIQVIDSLSLGLALKPMMAFSPELRSAVAASPLTSNDAGFIVFEGTLQDGQKLYYQMVRETENEVFLSVKIDGEKSFEKYRQVILKREGRFILSSKINSEGVVNFPSLKEGSYSLEFFSPPQNKVIDLYLMID